MHIHTVAGFAVIAATLAILGLPSSARAVDESKSESIGPWEIEATFKGDKLDRCTISRKLDNDIVASFVKSTDALTLLLESPNWKLDRGQQYKVTMKLGPQNFDSDVAAESDSVSVNVKDEKFVSGLRSANVLNVVAAGATIDVPLDRSTDAFERLDECVAKNSTAVQSNPFVAPPRRP